jgi:geranylgeranyl diphosphate synthase type I
MDLEAVMRARRKLVDDELAGALAGVGPEPLRDAARWYPDAGGKRLRPILAMLACEAAGGAREQALPIALAVELVHNFSLVHDDIMDRDATRRGRATVHVKWDEPTAILAGDVLFARAFEVLARIPDADAHREAATLLSHAVLKLCEGQALDMAFEARGDVDEDEYVRMIRGKTALLFEAATRGGALASPRRAPVAVASLSAYGEAFGMAFQIADDLLDITSDAQTLGKPWGSDVRAGKRTLLTIAARARATPQQRRALDATLGRADASDEDVRRVAAVLRDTGALAHAEALRDAHAARAEKALDALAESEAREALRAINRWATMRRA